MEKDTRKRRLLMISTDRRIFEEGSSVRQRQIEYAKNWEEVHIIIFAKKGKFPRESSISSNCFAYSTSSFSKWTYVQGAISLGKFIISRRKISFITCQDPFLTATAGVSLKRHFHIPLELQIHTDISSPNFTYKFSNKIRKALALSYLKNADNVRVVSARVKEYILKNQLTTGEIEIRPILVDRESIQRTEIKVDLKKKYLEWRKVALIASRLEPEKNIEMAIRAWSKGFHDTNDALLVIVGSGSKLNSLKSLVYRLDISKNVIFEPWIDRETLISYFKTADVFINTSLFEGYGMTIVEALSAGCKVISTDVGVARAEGAEIISNEEELAGALKDHLK